LKEPSGGGWGASSELQDWEQRGAGHICEKQIQTAMKKMAKKKKLMETAPQE